jgi:hypothetical protein
MSDHPKRRGVKTRPTDPLNHKDNHGFEQSNIA